MSTRTLGLEAPLYDYLLSVSLREAPVLARLRAETASHPKVNMQIAPEQGQFMALLARLIGARHCIEIGVFTGYSSLAVALALPDGGRIVACDVSDEYTAVARRYWAEAGVADRVDLRIGPALDTLDALAAEGAAGSFDFAFVDAAKSEYPDYYRRLLPLMRPGGLVAYDNVFRHGDVADPEQESEALRATRELNDILAADERVDVAMVPIADGMTLARLRD